MTRPDGKRVVTLYLDPELHRAIKVRAAELGVTIPSFITACIKAVLGGKGE